MRVAKNPKLPKAFLRNALKMPGKSWHSGRGWYDMEHAKTREYMVSGLRELAAKHSFLTLEEKEIPRMTCGGEPLPPNTVMYLTFANYVEDVGPFGSPENYYRHFQYNVTTNELVNSM